MTSTPLSGTTKYRNLMRDSIIYADKYDKNCDLEAHSIVAN